MQRTISQFFFGLSTRNICNLSRLWQYPLCSYLLPKTAKTFDYVTFGKSVPHEGNFRNTLLTEWDIQVFTTYFLGTDYLLDAPDCMYTSTWIVPTTGHKPIGLVLKWPCAGFVHSRMLSTHNTLQVLQRTALGPATPKVGSDSTNEFKCTVNTDRKRKCKKKI